MPHERIGVVDAQWIKHKAVPSLGDQVKKLLIQQMLIVFVCVCVCVFLWVIINFFVWQGQAVDGREPWEGVSG